MKKLIIVLLVAINFVQSLGQNLFPVDSMGLNFFLRGSEYIENGDFKSADSLLTLALCSYKNENVYFNRALSRLFLYDTIGYCQDMDFAANRYFDKQAEVYFNSLCCSKVDTVFYDKERNVTQSDQYRYYEIVKNLKYDPIIKGTFHDVKSNLPKMTFDFGCDSKALGILSTSTDMIAGYHIENNRKYYFQASKPVSVYNHIAYDDLKKRAAILLSTKYNFLKKENKTDKLRVFFQLYVSESGEIDKVKYMGFYPEIFFDEVNSKLEIDLLDIADSYPSVKPARFFKHKVGFITYDFVEF